MPLLCNRHSAKGLAIGNLPVLRYNAHQVTSIPLNALDRLFLAQEYPGVSLAGHVFIELERPLEKEALLQAIRDIGAARPELGCRIATGWFYPKRVRVSGWPDANTVLQWQAAIFNPVDPDLDRPFRLETEPGFRLTHGPCENGGAVIVLSAHHALMDGVGQLTLLKQILSAYSARLTGKTYFPAAPEPVRLRKLFLKRFGFFGTLKRALLGFSPIKPFREKNASLLETDFGGPSPIRSRLVTLTPEQEKCIKDFGRHRRITRHTVILTALLRACDRWQTENGRKDRHYRVMHPVNARHTLGVHPEQLQNFVGSIESRFDPKEIRSEKFPEIIGRHMGMLKDPDRLLANIFHLTFLATLLPIRWLNRELEKFDLNPKNFYYSLLFTHLASPDWPEIPQNSVRSFWGRGSLTRQPGIGVALATGRGTRLCFYAHSKSFSERGLDRIVSLFTESLGQF